MQQHCIKPLHCLENLLCANGNPRPTYASTHSKSLANRSARTTSPTFATSTFAAHPSATLSAIHFAAANSQAELQIPNAARSIIEMEQNIDKAMAIKHPTMSKKIGSANTASVFTVQSTTIAALVQTPRNGRKFEWQRSAFANSPSAFSASAFSPEWTGVVIISITVHAAVKMSTYYAVARHIAAIATGKQSLRA
jgi:hypothetical protein